MTNHVFVRTWNPFVDTGMYALKHWLEKESIRDIGADELHGVIDKVVEQLYADEAADGPNDVASIRLL